MPRLLASASIAFIVIGSAALPAVAQMGPKVIQMGQNVSPEQQAEQRAAKSVDCRKEAKAQKLSGAKRRAFLKDCMKK